MLLDTPFSFRFLFWDFWRKNVPTVFFSCRQIVNYIWWHEKEAHFWVFSLNIYFITFYKIQDLCWFQFNIIQLTKLWSLVWHLYNSFVPLILGSLFIAPFIYCTVSHKWNWEYNIYFCMSPNYFMLFSYFRLTIVQACPGNIFFLTTSLILPSSSPQPWMRKDWVIPLIQTPSKGNMKVS